MTTVRIPFAFILSILFSTSIFAKGFTSNQIDSIVNKAMTSMPHAGMAVLVVKDGVVVHAKGYGVTSSISKEKVNEHTRFAIASNSKAFTSSALAILVEEGKLKWTDKVVDYIPEFKMYDPYVTANFTILDLLTHRSGLGLGAGDLMFFPDGGDYKMIDILKSFQYQKQVSDFRTKYDYDNLLYVVAGEIITRISGLSWSEFIEQNIMNPLNMVESAGTYQRLKNKTNVALPHKLVDGKSIPFDAMDIELGAAAAGIYTSISDLSNWLRMHLNEGKFGETELISKNNHNEMWKPQTNIMFQAKAIAPYFNHYTAYGLGWQLNDANGMTVVSHTGGLPGMLSKTTLIPELNLGIVVLTNCDPGGYSFHTIAGLIADSYMGIEGYDWLERAKQLISNQEEEDREIVNKVWSRVDSLKNVKSTIKASDFVGTYKDPWFGEIEITYVEHSKTEKSTNRAKVNSVSNGQFYIKCLRSPKLSGWMYFYNANTFAIKWDYQDMPCDAFASFTLDETGKATSFTMKGISPNIDFSFDFQDLNVKRIK